MESIKDPDRLSVEMRKHFQMTEEVIALMLERKKLMEAQAPTSGTSSSGQPATPSRPGMGGRVGGGMPGGMMPRGMGGMPGGGMPGGMTQREPGGMSSGGGMPAPGAPVPQSSQMDEMMKRIAEHSAYMETIQERGALSQEMLRHQKMLDQMLQLMQ